MKAKYKERWLKDLRSGEFKQGKERLRQGNQNGSRFCCLGVLELQLPTRSEFRDGLDRRCREEAGLTPREHNHCIQLNDHEGKSFAEIADWIEGNIPAE